MLARLIQPEPMDSNPGISLFQGGINVENALQNQEEAEDLEDQKRRQEEIQSLLTKAMDEFNYDDQSTVNSSTNVSVNESDYNRKYKETSMDDQLKVLYEVRVREVRALTDQVNTLKHQHAHQKDSVLKRLMLAEAEKDRAQISLRQSQELLVSSSEEITKLQKEVENFGNSIQNSEERVKLLEEERDSLKHANRDLIEQLTIIQKGLSTNTVSERQLQEGHLAEVNKLHHNLENALMKLERQEREYGELEHSYKKKCQEKDELMVEKSEIINRLTESLDGAQQQCRELLQIVEVVNHENQKLKRNASSYDLATTIQSGLSDKTEIIKVLQKELDKASDLQHKRLVDFEKLQQVYSELHRDHGAILTNFEHFKAENKALLQANQLLEMKIKMQYDEVCKLDGELEKYCNVQSENEILQKRINSLEVIINGMQTKDTKEHSVQVSQIMSSFCEQNDLNKGEIQRLESQLQESTDKLVCVQARLLEYEEEVHALMTKVSLEKERDHLIQSLQDKAAQFQEIILQRQAKQNGVDTGVNTDKTSDNVELLKTQFDTELIMRETNLRLEIQREFDSKAVIAAKDACTNCKRTADLFKESECKMQAKVSAYERAIESLGRQPAECAKLHRELSNLKTSLQSQNGVVETLKHEQMLDRETIVKVLDEWRSKFQALEAVNHELVMELDKAERAYAEAEEKLAIREKGDAQLAEDLQKDTMNLVKQWNQKAVESIQKLTTAQHTKILESNHKIDHISKKADKKIKDIELKYKKSQEVYEKSSRRQTFYALCSEVGVEKVGI